MDAVIRKLVSGLVLPLAFLTFINALDRVNISFAAQAMSKGIGLTPQSFGFGVSLFFVAYVLFQYPHAAFLRRFGVRWWLLLSLLLWGVAGVGMANVKSVGGFYAMRFLLGVAESGFAPGVTWYISLWVPMQARAKAMGIVLSAIPFSLVLGGPLCGWMLGSSNPFGLAEWRWMFLLQSIPNFLVAGFAYFHFRDGPDQVTWLGPDDKQLLNAELARQEGGSAAPAATAASVTSSVSALWDPRTLLCALLWLLVMTGAYALLFWLPQLVRQMALGGSELQIGVISSLPQAGIVVGLLVNGWHSDRSNERLWHFGLGAVGAGVALFVSALLAPGWLVMALMILAGIGIGAAQGVFWTMPAATGVGGGRVPVSVIALINMSGTMGGVIGPAVTGAVRQHLGSFGPAILLLALMLLATGLVLPLLGRVTRMRLQPQGVAP